MKRRLLLAGPMAALLTASYASDAADFCENLEGERTIVGEARYTVIEGVDTAYANCFWDGVDSPAKMGFPAGGAHNNAVSLGFFGVVHVGDETAGDCTNVFTELRLDGGTNPAGPCPAPPFSTSLPNVIVNTCAAGAGDHVRAANLVGQGTLPYRRYWKGTITVTGDEVTTSNQGCWQVYDQTLCSLL